MYIALFFRHYTFAFVERVQQELSVQYSSMLTDITT